MKIVLQRWKMAGLRDIISEPITAWHNVELPDLTTQYADLLAETSSGRLWHIERQTWNDREMPARMLEYATRIYRKFKRLPGQVVYVGSDPLRMDDGVAGEGLSFHYYVVSARDMDREALLSSRSAGDNILAVLTRTGTSAEVIRRVLNAIAILDNQDREVAFEALLVLSSLRELEETIEEEARKMRIFDDILENKVLGREYKRGLEEGRQSQLKLIRLILSERFGAIAPEIESRIATMTLPELEGLAPRLLHAATLEELLR